VLNAGPTPDAGNDAVMNGGNQEHTGEAIAVMSQYSRRAGVRTFPTLQGPRDEDYREAVFNKISIRHRARYQPGKRYPAPLASPC